MISSPVYPEIIYIPALNSTNDDLKHRVMQNHILPEYSSVRTGRQLAGRGRMGRIWIGNDDGDLNEADGNLYYSVLLRPKQQNIIPQISLIAGVALITALHEACPDLKKNLSLKWPNDLLFNTKKVAGILCENFIHEGINYIIVGTGVNLCHHPQNLPDYQATNLGLDKDFATQFAPYYLEKIIKYIECATLKGFEAIKPLWLKYGHAINSKIKLKIADKIHHGFFAGLGEDGCLYMHAKPILNDKSFDKDAITRFYIGDILQ